MYIIIIIAYFQKFEWKSYVSRTVSPLEDFRRRKNTTNSLCVCCLLTTNTFFNIKFLLVQHADKCSYHDNCKISLISLT